MCRAPTAGRSCRQDAALFLTAAELRLSKQLINPKSSYTSSLGVSVYLIAFGACRDRCYKPKQVGTGEISSVLSSVNTDGSESAAYSTDNVHCDSWCRSSSSQTPYREECCGARDRHCHTKLHHNCCEDSTASFTFNILTKIVDSCVFVTSGDLSPFSAISRPTYLKLLHYLRWNSSPTANLVIENGSLACERVGELLKRRIPTQAMPTAWGLPVPAPWSEDSTLVQSQATLDIPPSVNVVRSAYVQLPK